MPRFFIPTEQMGEGSVTVLGADAFHIARALRMACGEEIVVCDSKMQVHTCRLTKITDSAVEAEILSTKEADTEPPVALHLYQAWPKGDKMELIVQKATELGAASITPFLSERCVKVPKEDKVEKQLSRLSRIAAEAAGQCGRAVLPSVNDPLSFIGLCEAIKKHDAMLFCYEGEGTLSIKAALKDLSAPKSIGVIVGAEGGFSQKEAEQLCKAGAVSVGLGKRILRCETAPLFALSALLYHYEL